MEDLMFCIMESKDPGVQSGYTRQKIFVDTQR